MFVDIKVSHDDLETQRRPEASIQVRGHVWRGGDRGVPLPPLHEGSRGRDTVTGQQLYITIIRIPFLEIWSKPLLHFSLVSFY